jgi:hypothetical protein
MGKVKTNEDTTCKTNEGEGVRPLHTNVARRFL